MFHCLLAFVFSIKKLVLSFLVTLKGHMSFTLSLFSVAFMRFLDLGFYKRIP